MRLLADVHISPRTVAWLCSIGHDAVRVSDVLSPRATDSEIVAEAVRDDRVILTQDLDFSALVALSGSPGPAVVSLRLRSSRVEWVNERLARVLPLLEDDLAAGALVSIEDSRVRTRKPPKW